MPRFVILEHDHPHLHWDLMLEVGTVLRTWRLASAPGAGVSVPAEAIGDHRQLYLDYEGPVSGDRGKVTRWDSGTFTGELPELVPVGGKFELRLNGQYLLGLATLTRQSQALWLFEVLRSGDVP